MRADNPGTGISIFFCFHFNSISFPSSPLSQSSFLCLPLRLLAPFYLFHQCTSFSFLRALFPGQHFWPHQPLYAHQSLSSLPTSTVFNCLRCCSLGHISLPLPPGQPSSQGKGDAWDLVFFPPWLSQPSRLCSSPEHRTQFSKTGMFVVMTTVWEALTLYLEWKCPQVLFPVLTCLLAWKLITLLNSAFIILPLLFIFELCKYS